MSSTLCSPSLTDAAPPRREASPPPPPSDDPDAAAEPEESEEQGEPEEPKPTSEQQKAVVHEDRRVLALVNAIDHDAAVVPRGAYILNAAQEIIRNRSFEGIGGCGGGFAQHLRAGW